MAKEAPSAEASLKTPEAKIDKVLALLQKWPGADADDAGTKDPKAEVPPQAHDAAARARKKYDGTLRWILGVFSAIGLLIFGSLPFTELTNVQPTRLFAGLLLAAAGLGIIIWATARGLELQDASLGELSFSFKKRADSFGNVWPWLRSPRRRANAELKEIMEGGAEATAHLGPGIKTVDQLIMRMGQLEARAMYAYLSWDGGHPVEGASDSQDPLHPADLPGVPWLRHSVAANSALAESAKKELESLQTALVELRKQAAEEGADKTDVKDVLIKTEERYRKTLGLLPDTTHLEASATSKAWDELRDFYQSHRELVLEESLVAQMRGTFAVVLRWLMLGAALVAVGGLVYAFAIANPTSEGSLKNPVQVTVNGKSDAVKEIVDDKCVDDAKTDSDVTLAALLVTSRDSDGLQDGPFRFTPLSGECAGKTYDVGEGDGRYVRMAATPSEPVTSPGSPADGQEPSWTPVTVTVLPNTPAWHTLDTCRTTAEDVTNVPALLVKSDDADAQHDGPFTARITSGQCAGAEVSVPDGDGLYVVQR